MGRRIDLAGPESVRRRNFGLRVHSSTGSQSGRNSTSLRSTTAGLAAYAYTADIGRSWRLAEQLEYGMVGLNTGMISTEVSPFGGVKESGLGREGARAGLEEFLETRAVCMGI